MDLGPFETDIDDISFTRTLSDASDIHVTDAAPDTPTQRLSPRVSRKRKKSNLNADTMSDDDSSSSSAPASNCTSPSRNSFRFKPVVPKAVTASPPLQNHVRATPGPLVVCTYQFQSQANARNALQALPVYHANSSYKRSESSVHPLLGPVVVADSIETADVQNSRRNLSLFVESLPPEASTIQSSRSIRGPSGLETARAILTLPLNRISDPAIESYYASTTQQPPPPNLPIELLDIIVRYLSLDDVKNLRLVSKTFERGVSANLFRSIYVPFSKDIFGALSDASGLVPQDSSNHISEKAKGKRRATQNFRDIDIFRGFGSHVRQFAIRFEVDEIALLEPPIKDSRQGHATFWGDFDWPYPNYCRFSDRASLELTADETSTMKLAFSHLTNAQHLALSLDAGLGWIDGPDKSLRSAFLADRPSIFQNRSHQTPADVLARRRFWISIEHWYASCGRFNDLQRAALYHVEDKDPVSIHNTSITPYLFPRGLFSTHVLSSKATIGVAAKTESDKYPVDSGNLAGSDLEDASATTDEDTPPRLPRSNRGILASDTPRALNSRDRAPSSQRSTMVAAAGNTDQTHHDGATEDQHGSDLEHGTAPGLANRLNSHVLARSFRRLGSRLMPDRTDQRRFTQHRVLSNNRIPETSSAQSSNHMDPSGKESRFALVTDPGQLGAGYLCIQGQNPLEFKAIASKHKLNPTNLTKSQKEWLLETAWAQDAFLSSYMLAVVDNTSTFENVARLTLSRVSSRHALKLQRHDFWSSLPCLTDLDIRVIADWQDISRVSDGNAEVRQVLLAEALNAFHSLLKTIICRKRSIKRLTMGWVEGGEHAPGIFARNVRVLPAPVMNMDDIDFGRRKFVSTVVFSSVEILTLVNCWLTPHMFRDFIEQNVGGNMAELILDSVSLTADTHVPMDGGQAQAHAQAQVIALMQGHAHPQFNDIHGLAVRQLNAAAPANNRRSTSYGVNQFPLHGTIPPPDYFPNNNRTSEMENLFYPMTGHETPTLSASDGSTSSWSVYDARWQSCVLVQAAGQGGQPGFANWITLNNPGAGVNGNAAHRQVLRGNCWPELLHWLQSFWETNSDQPFSLCLRSAGYVRLQGVQFDQSALENYTDHVHDALLNNPPNLYSPEAFFAQRATALAGVMMSSTENILGSIVTRLPPDEEDALLLDWNMIRGWPDSPDLQGDHYDDDDGWGRWGDFTKRAALYDGHRPGGWGRFSGIVSLNDSDTLLQKARREQME